MPYRAPRIEPEPHAGRGHRLREVATQVRLRNLSLRQVFAFFKAMGYRPAHSPPQRSRSATIRLTAHGAADETFDRCPRIHRHLHRLLAAHRFPHRIIQ